MTDAGIVEFDRQIRARLGRAAAYPDWRPEEAEMLEPSVREAAVETAGPGLRSYLASIALEHGMKLPDQWLWRGYGEAERSPFFRSRHLQCLASSASGSPENVAALLRWLPEKEAPERDVLIGMASRWRARECVALLSQLAREDDEVAIPALNALRRIDPAGEGTRELLLGFASDADWALRETASRGLAAPTRELPRPLGVTALSREELRRLERESEVHAARKIMAGMQQMAMAGKADPAVLAEYYEYHHQRRRRYTLREKLFGGFRRPIDHAAAELSWRFAGEFLQSLAGVTGGRLPSSAAAFCASSLSGLEPGMAAGWRIELVPGEKRSIYLTGDQRFAAGEQGFRFDFARGEGELFLSLTCDSWDDIAVSCWCRDQAVILAVQAAALEADDREESEAAAFRPDGNEHPAS